jgi:hypothetical protein
LHINNTTATRTTTYLNHLPATSITSLLPAPLMTRGPRVVTEALHRVTSHHHSLLPSAPTTNIRLRGHCSCTYLPPLSTAHHTSIPMHSVWLERWHGASLPWGRRVCRDTTTNTPVITLLSIALVYQQNNSPTRNNLPKPSPRYTDHQPSTSTAYNQGPKGLHLLLTYPCVRSSWSSSSVRRYHGDGASVMTPPPTHLS